MPLDCDTLFAMPPMESRQTFTTRDTILYALGVGAGLSRPNAPEELKFVFEENLSALPTMAAVLAHPGFWAKDPRYGIDWRKMLHGEQSIRLHRPLPVEGTVRGVTTIEGVYDRGPERGAILYQRRDLFDDAGGDLLATALQTNILRGDGGCGSNMDRRPALPDAPETPPDEILRMATHPAQALIYRLSGDYNPLHADPTAALRSGFPAPVLHGLATYGVAGRAILQMLCDDDPQRISRYDVRFSSPVYPGDELEIALWRLGPDRAAVRASVPARNVVVLQNGYVELRAPAI